MTPGWVDRFPDAPQPGDPERIRVVTRAVPPTPCNIFAWVALVCPHGRVHLQVPMVAN